MLLLLLMLLCEEFKRVEGLIYIGGWWEREKVSSNRSKRKTPRELNSVQPRFGFARLAFSNLGKMIYIGIYNNVLIRRV